MTFARWLSISDAEREKEKRTWRPFEPGDWHALATEAAARFNAEFGSTRHVTKVFKSLYRSRELIVAVQTDSAPGKELKLPGTYCGFRVVQFAGQLPEGVLVEVGPPSELSPRPKRAGRRSEAPIARAPVRAAVAGLHRVVPLEGEIDLHVSAGVAAKLRAAIQEKPEKVVIDLSKVTYIDSSGLAALINAMQEVEAYRGKLYLVALDEPVRIIFETLRLNQVFRIRLNIADALAAV